MLKPTLFDHDRATSSASGRVSNGTPWTVSAPPVEWVAGRGRAHPRRARIYNSAWPPRRIGTCPLVSRHARCGSTSGRRRPGRRRTRSSKMSRPVRRAGVRGDRTWSLATIERQSAAPWAPLVGRSSVQRYPPLGTLRAFLPPVLVVRVPLLCHGHPVPLSRILRCTRPHP